MGSSNYIGYKLRVLQMFNTLLVETENKIIFDIIILRPDLLLRRPTQVKINM